MEQIRAKIKKWGNSFGIVVPMDIVKKNNLIEETDVTVTIQISRPTTVGEAMEIGRKYGIPAKMKNIDTLKALREVDNLFWPENE